MVGKEPGEGCEWYWDGEEGGRGRKPASRVKEWLLRSRNFVKMIPLVARRVWNCMELHFS